MIRPLVLLAALASLAAAPSAASAAEVPATWEHGFSFTGYNAGDYTGAVPAASLDRLADTGANAVAIYTTWYQASPTATAIGPDAARTPSETGLVARIRQAKARGLRVMLRPHVSSKTGAEWRGRFEPSDVGAWFASYRDMINHFADLATAHGVDSLEIGSEFETLSTHDAEWRRVIANARERFRGTVLYGANHSEFPYVRWLDAVDQVGIDAYWSLSCPDRSSTPGEAALVAAWKARLDEIQAVRARNNWKTTDVVFAEVGYRNIVGNTCDPWDYSRTAARDDAAQQRALSALFTAASPYPWFRGLYLWRWPADACPGRSPATDFPVVGKPAEDTVRSWFGGTVPAGPAPCLAAGPEPGEPATPAVPPAPAPAAPVAPAGPATPGAQTTSPSAGPRAIAGTPVAGGSASTSGSAPSGSPAALTPLSLTVRRSGALLAVRGRLTTRREVRLALQRRSGGRYRTVSVLRVRPGRDGRFARRLRVTRSGVYKVRASATGARTATRTLRVSVRR